MSEKEKPDWEITRPLPTLKDDRPEECKNCDYDWYEDCTVGCQKFL